MMQPKVLILSERFSSGDAITGLNLFSRWDKRKLFCASRTGEFFGNNFNSTYLLGNDEVIFTFPFSLFNKLPNSEVNPLYSLTHQSKKKSLLKLIYLNIIIPILWFFNLFDRRVKYKVSQKFLSWFDMIEPDYIYTSIGSLDMARFIDELLSKRPGVKLIYHGYDDWVNPNHKCINKAYSVKSDIILSSILKKSAIRLAMSDKMVQEYTNRYHHEFKTMPNPSLPVRSANNQKNKSIVFVGKIGFHNRDAIKMMAQALRIIENKLGVILNFEIYSLVDDNVMKSLLGLYSHCKFMGWRTHDEIKQILCRSRILYLPISMSESTKRFTKYSMSTKMSEYLSSGTAMLYFGPSGIAMTELLETNKCAFVVKNNDVNELVSAIETIFVNPQIEGEIINNAVTLFESSFSMAAITSKLHDIIYTDYVS